MRNVFSIALVACVAVGCVTTGTFDDKVAEDNRKLADMTAQRDALQKKLDETTATLKSQLASLGKAAAAEKGQLNQSLADLNAQLEELRKQKAAADARAEVFHNLVKKLRSMIDAGQLKVAIRNGRMIIQLPNDVLFDSGATKIKKDGQETLAHVAQVLATINDRHFIIAGHTDTQRIHTARFPSNWELSADRAVEVTKFLVANGMKAELLAAAGYGEYDPVAGNDDKEHMAQNRRIEIVLEPNLADLPPMGDLQKSEPTSGTPTTPPAAPEAAPSEKH